jgi:Domain of unknown function (DUF4397)
MLDVKNLRVWSVIGVAGLVLAACGGSSEESSDSTAIRLVNATLTHPSLDLLVNSTVAVPATIADTASAYVAPAAGSNTLQLNDAGATTALAVTVPTLTAGSHYTLVAYESGGTVKSAVLNEDFSTPTSGTVQLRLYNTAPEAGKLDVYITDPATDLASVTAPTASVTTLASLTSLGPLTYSPGTYRVRVTGYGNKGDLRIDIPAVTLTNQQVANVVLTPASGGVLLNGATLIQQGAYTATRNTNARVRLAAAVSGNASVAAAAGSTVIDAGSVAPKFGYYALVPAGSALNISVNGQSVSAPATALTAGSDATLLVYGNAGAASAALIADDNRPPSDTTTVKLRLINGITGNVGALSLTANAAPVGNGILPGAASGYVAVPGSANAMNLSLTASAVPGALYTNTSNTLNANTVYTVLAGGDVAAPQLLIR